MSSTIKIKNLSRLERKLSKLPSDLLVPLRTQVYLSAESIRKTAVKGIQKGGRTGKFYTRGNKVAQRSAPGEYPKSDRSTLVKSIFTRPISGLNKLAYKVGTRLKYGQYLEFGNSKMAPRPWLFPSFKENLRDIKKDIRRAVLKALKKGRGL